MTAAVTETGCRDLNVCTRVPLHRIRTTHSPSRRRLLRQLLMGRAIMACRRRLLAHAAAGQRGAAWQLPLLRLAGGHGARAVRAGQLADHDAEAHTIHLLKRARVLHTHTKEVGQA